MKSINITLTIEQPNGLNSRYQTNNRRVIGAIVGWGAVSSKVSSKRKKWGTCLSRLLPVGNYARLAVVFLASLYSLLTLYTILRASTTTMVIGHLMASLALRVKPNITGDFKTFCIGHSLGGQMCGFAGKDYRYR